MSDKDKSKRELVNESEIAIANERRRDGMARTAGRHFSGDAVPLHAANADTDNMRCRADIVRPPARTGGTNEK